MQENEGPNHRLISIETLRRYIESQGETRHVDAKGPIQWDGADTSAGLAKDIIAFANTRDGGVLVIGKSEPSPGKFLFPGISEAEARQFDTTKVATWVNNYCSPSIALECYPVPVNSTFFVVIIVPEFNDIPIICIKDYQRTTDKKYLLRKGAIYIRTSNVESSAIESSEALRELVGIATSKQTNQLVERFLEMTKGRALLQPPSPKAMYSKERDAIVSMEAPQFSKNSSEGNWILEFYPSHYNKSYWDGSDTLTSMAKHAAVNIRQEYPPLMAPPQVFDWGIYNQYSDDSFALTYSGYFYSKRAFREDPYASGQIMWHPNTQLDPGKWLDIKITSNAVIEFFIFLSRFVKNYRLGEELTVIASGNGLHGRTMISVDPMHHLTPRGPCLAPTFSKEMTLTAEELVGDWRKICAFYLTEFYSRFNGPAIEIESVLKNIDNFENRRT